ncbi:Fc receptor-like protein 1 [Ammospiza maritima maritima]
MRVPPTDRPRAPGTGHRAPGTGHTPGIHQAPHRAPHQAHTGHSTGHRTGHTPGAGHTPGIHQAPHRAPGTALGTHRAQHRAPHRDHGDRLQGLGGILDIREVVVVSAGDSDSARTPSPLRPPAPLLYLFYRDGCEVQTQFGTVRKGSARLSVTVRRVPPSGVSLSAQPPGGQVALGDSLVLSCAVAMGTGPLSFSWHREGSGAPLGTGPRLELGHVGDNDSGQYRCRVSDGDSVAESDTMNVTVLVPVANATITPGPLAQQVHAGDNVTLRCSVQVGSAPVTFTWLHNGQEVARGPLLEFGDINVGHSGTWQCVATNQLGQDGHRVFRTTSPELALEVTTWGHRDTAVAAGVGSSLLALVLLGVAIVGWQRCHRRAPRTPQDRTPVVPLEGEEVLYSHVVPTARAAGSPSATPEEPQVTYAELRAPRWHLGDSGDYENVL